MENQNAPVKIRNSCVFGHMPGEEKTCRWCIKANANKEQREYAAKVAFGQDEQMRRISPDCKPANNLVPQLSFNVSLKTLEERENQIYFEKWLQQDIARIFDPFGGSFFPQDLPPTRKDAIKLKELHEKMREMAKDFNIQFITPRAKRFYDPYFSDIATTIAIDPESQKKFLTIQRGKHRSSLVDKDGNLKPVLDSHHLFGTLDGVKMFEGFFYEVDESKPKNDIMKEVRNISEHPPKENDHE